MRWTPEKVEELRGLAPKGSMAAAAHFDISRRVVVRKAGKEGISIARHPFLDTSHAYNVTPSRDGHLRARLKGSGASGDAGERGDGATVAD
jgi:hypothetical protein